jgi:hypothetical protein
VSCNCCLCYPGSQARPASPPDHCPPVGLVWLEAKQQPKEWGAGTRCSHQSPAITLSLQPQELQTNNLTQWEVSVPPPLGGGFLLSLLGT